MELHKLDNYDIEFIESLIMNEIEESINLDFKSADALSKADAKKKEISKDVSAFANSNGGIIIYGVNEINHKASELSFVNGNEFTKEWLEQVISSTIQRNIPNLKIFPIRKSGQIEKTIYVVQIPESFEAPHIAKDKKFYKRYNFESVAMEEYEVRNLYGKKLKSKLILSGYNISCIGVEGDEVKFMCQSGVINEGEIAEPDYKVNVYFNNYDSSNIKIHWRVDGVSRNSDYTILGNNRVKISNTGISTIFPNETVNVIRFNFDIKKIKLRKS
ncbi:ATP-binding protein [Myroides sp. mNGS23_01]|nr:ATP-binding protein [Myroides sp. mNGS23_01]WHT40378.1 ATP-binding protein [Myroides sp. mNGS23_01]